MAPVNLDLPGAAATRAALGPDGSELARVRSALARGSPSAPAAAATSAVRSVERLS